MKYLLSKIFSVSLFLSLPSFASASVHNNLIIQAIPSSEGTVVIEGKPMYEKTFKVVVYSTVKQPTELTGYKGCYKAFDALGNEFYDRIVQLELLGILKEQAKEGEISFISSDESVYNARFIKWSTNCLHLAKKTDK